MIWKGDGVLVMEEAEPILRSCWECNEAHHHLKDVIWLHYCLWCGRYWIFGQYLEMETDEEFDAFFQAQGMKPGDSTGEVSTRRHNPQG